MAGIQVKATKTKNDLIYMVLDQMGDSTTDVTSVTIAKEIKKVSGFDVHSEYIEDFMNGLSMRVQAYLTSLVAQIMSGYIVEALIDGELLALIKKHRSKIWSSIKKIPDIVKNPKGGLKGIFSSTMAKGKGGTSIEIAEFKSSFDTYMTCQNVGLTLGNGIQGVQMHNGALESARAVDGDNKMLGSNSLLKAVMEFKATAKQGF